MTRLMFWGVALLYGIIFIIELLGEVKDTLSRWYKKGVRSLTRIGWK